MTTNVQRCILAIVAHPDDEVLGCGGTLAAWSRAGGQTHVLCLADGETARYQDRNAPEARQRIEQRRAAARKSAAVIGLTSIRFLDFPDNRLDGVELLDVVRPIEVLLQELTPDTVYTHHGGDLNLDHRITHQAVTTACRPLPGRSVQRVYAFETPSSTDWATEAHGPVFRANLFIDISTTLDAKIAALQAYDEEMHPFPHPRSLEGVKVLARQRGACVGVAAAEAFMLVRELYLQGTPADELTGAAG
jgi:N-acetylglucosamine malate deacetylase 1